MPRARCPPPSSRAVEVLELDPVPAHRALKGQIAQHLGIGIPGVGIGAQQEAQDTDIAEHRDAAPGVESDTGEHDRVAGARLAVRRRENDPMTVLGQYFPAHRDFRGVEIATGDRE